MKKKTYFLKDPLITAKNETISYDIYYILLYLLYLIIFTISYYIYYILLYLLYYILLSSNVTLVCIFQSG